MTENPTPIRFNRKVETGENYQFKTTWDKDSLDTTLAFFQAVFESIKPLGVSARIGEDFELENEDLELLTDPLNKSDTIVLNVLHLFVFFPESSPEENTELLYVAESMWYQKLAKEGEQFLEMHIYNLPINLSSGRTIKTLDESLELLHIDQATYKKIYPNQETT